MPEASAQVLRCQQQRHPVCSWHLILLLQLLYLLQKERN